MRNGNAKKKVKIYLFLIININNAFKHKVMHKVVF